MALVSEAGDDRTSKRCKDVHPKIRPVAVHFIAHNVLEDGLGQADCRVEASSGLAAGNADHCEKCKGYSQAAEEALSGRRSFLGLDDKIAHNKNESANGLNLVGVPDCNVDCGGLEVKDLRDRDVGPSGECVHF